MTDQALWFKPIISVLRILFSEVKAVKVFSHILAHPRESYGKIADLNNKLPTPVWTKNDHPSSRFLRPTFRDEVGFLHKYACHNCRKKIECAVFQDHVFQRCLAFLWSTWNFLLRLWPTYLPLLPKDIDTLCNGIRFGSELGRRTQNEDHRSNIYQYVTSLSLFVHGVCLMIHRSTYNPNTLLWL